MPLLTLIGIPIHQAIGTSLAFIACASLAGMVQHIRQGSIDLTIAWFLTIPATVMAKISAQFSGRIPALTFFWLFAVLLLTVMAMYHFYPLSALQQSSSDQQPRIAPWYVLRRHSMVVNVSYHYNVNVIKAILSGLASGALTGFFGVGGGFLLVPLGVMVLHIPLRVTIGTCLAVTVLPAWVGTFTHWQLGHVNLGIWLPLVLTGILSSQLGARCVIRFQPALLKRLFLLLMLTGAMYMLSKGLMG